MIEVNRNDADTVAQISWYYTHAIRTLHNFSLIEFDDDPTHVTVHPMASRVLVEFLNLFPDRLAKISRTVLEVVGSFLDQHDILPAVSEEKVRDYTEERLTQAGREALFEWEEILWSSYGIFDVVARIAKKISAFSQTYRIYRKTANA